MLVNRGIKHSAFYPVTGKWASQFVLYNHYLRPLWTLGPLEEYRILRTAVGLYDITGEKVIEIAGPDALDVVDAAVLRSARGLTDGRCLYTAMCYDHGGIVDDGVLLRFSPDRFWFVGGEGAAEPWLHGLALGKRVTVRSHLDTLHVLGLHGPNATSALQTVIDVDLTRVRRSDVVPSARVAGVHATLTRTGWTGEDGYELYVSVDEGAVLCERLLEAGRPFGLHLCGSASLEMRRVENGVPMYGVDMDWTTTPYEVGLDWMLDFAKGPFHGREALLAASQNPPGRRLVGLEGQGDAIGVPRGRVLLDGLPVGAVTSATFSPALGKPVALAMVEARAAATGTLLQVDTRGKRQGAMVVPLPFDLEGRRGRRQHGASGG
ncbi:MAG TPA: aminomethyltransferase family protein [Chloroflexota bacterium]